MNAHYMSLPESLQIDEDVVAIFLKNRNFIFTKLHQSLLEDVAFIERMIRKNYSLIRYASKIKAIESLIESDHDLCIKALKYDGKLLQHMPSHIKSDKALVESLLDKNTYVARYASSKLRRRSLKVVCALLENIVVYKDDGIKRLISNMLPELKEIRESLLSLIGASARCYQYLDPAYIEDVDFALAALEVKPSCYQYFSAALKDNKAITDKALRLSKDNYQYVPDEIKKTDKLVFVNLFKGRYRNMPISCQAIKEANLKFHDDLLLCELAKNRIYSFGTRKRSFVSESEGRSITELEKILKKVPKFYLNSEKAVSILLQAMKPNHSAVYYKKIYDYFERFWIYGGRDYQRLLELQLVYFKFMSVVETLDDYGYDVEVSGKILGQYPSYQAFFETLWRPARHYLLSAIANSYHNLKERGGEAFSVNYHLQLLEQTYNKFLKSEKQPVLIDEALGWQQGDGGQYQFLNYNLAHKDQPLLNANLLKRDESIQSDIRAINEVNSKQNSVSATEVATSTGFFAVAKSRFSPIEGLKDKPLPKDGHCFYRGIALYLGRSYQEMKAIAARHLDNNYHKYQDFFDSIKTKAEHVNDILNSNKWAGDIEIQLLSDALARSIIVIGPDGDVRNLQNRFDGAADPIFIRYDGVNHYSALLVKNGFDANEIADSLQEQTINSFFL